MSALKPFLVLLLKNDQNNKGNNNNILVQFYFPVEKIRGGRVVLKYTLFVE